MHERNYYEKLSARLAKNCQICSGNLFEEVKCSNRDCDYFYMRYKVRKDLIKHESLLEDFNKSIEW